MKSVFKFTLILLSLAIGSCGNMNEPDQTAVSQNDPVSEMVSDFYLSVNPGTRAASAPRVIEKETKHYIIESDTVIETSATRSDDNVFELTTATLQFEDSKGFAILSCDERLDKVYFFTENGCLGDTINIPPLSSYIENIPFYAAEKIANSEKETKATQENFIVGPVVKYKWGQEMPFNMNAPSCECDKCKESGNHKVIGCVTVAMAQMIATMCRFTGTFYGNKNIDFQSLPEKGYNMNAQTSQTVASFFHEIALCCQIKFGCGASSGNTKAAFQYLCDMGYPSIYREGRLDLEFIKHELLLGIPHIISGSGNKGGHMWLIDGLSRQNGTTSFSCNWGWGGHCDGWVDGSPFIAKDTLNTIYFTFPRNIKSIYTITKL